jgi:hypothetical protein
VNGDGCASRPLAADQPGAGEVLDDRFKVFRVGRQVEQAVAGQVPLLLQRLQVLRQFPQSLGGGEVGAVVEDVLEEAVDRVGGAGVLAEGGEGLLRVRAEGVIILVAAAEADEGEVVGQKMTVPQAEDCGQQLAGRQVAGGAEDHQGERVRRLHAGQERRPLRQGRRTGRRLRTDDVGRWHESCAPLEVIPAADRSGGATVVYCSGVGRAVCRLFALPGREKRVYSPATLYREGPAFGPRRCPATERRESFMSTRCPLAAALLLAAVCTHAPGQTPPNYVIPPADDSRFSNPISYPEKLSTQTSVKSKLQMRIYEVADLIIPLGKTPAPPSLPQPAPAAPVLQTAATAARSEPASTLDKQLIGLLTDRIAPESWNTKGGPGSVDYYPLGMALIVNQTPAVHKQIRHLLESLRKLQDVEVAVEVRLISMSELVFEQIGIDFNKADAKPAAPPVGVTFLNDKQLRNFMEAVQGDQHTNVMQAPKLTVANGQRAEIKVEDRPSFVTKVNVVEAGGQFSFLPTNEPVTTGFRMSVQPAVSADRRSVLLNLKVSQTEPASPTAATFNTVTLDNTLTVPDGNSVLVGGWKRVTEGRAEFSPPVLSKIPYAERLFKQGGYGRETETVVLLVTPRILVNERKEHLSADVRRQKHDTEGEKEAKEIAKRAKVVRLVMQYHEALGNGDLEGARKLARRALELDPACFSLDSHGALRELWDDLQHMDDPPAETPEFERERLWFNDQSSKAPPERVHGGVGQ